MNPRKTHHLLTESHHKTRHQELHYSLDELTADFLFHHPGRPVETISALDLIQWSYAQTQNPTSPAVLAPLTQPALATRNSWAAIAEVLSDPPKYKRDIRPEPELVAKLLIAIALSIQEYGGDGATEQIQISLTEQEEAACMYAISGHAQFDSQLTTDLTDIP